MNVKKWIFVALQVLLALLFFTAGLPKLLGNEGLVRAFAGWGYPGWMIYMVGIAEMAGAVMLLIGATRKYGAALLAIIMVGATVTHVLADEWSRLPQVIVFAALLTVIFLREHKKPVAVEE